MAGSDDETVEVGMNEEQQLCGLAGDDDEEVVETFSASVNCVCLTSDIWSNNVKEDSCCSLHKL
jgi:hypothetical protein